MSKQAVVLSALAAALSFGNADASSAVGTNEESTSLEIRAPVLSGQIRDVLVQSASELLEQERSRPLQVRLAAFKLFEDGPSFVQAKPK